MFRRSHEIAVGILLLIAFGGTGCRSLRSQRHIQKLSEARVLSLEGASHLEQENYQEARTLFSEALKHSPEDERAHWGMAEVLWKQGEFTPAAQHMAQATSISGENPDLLVRLGEMYLSEGSLPEALDQAERALARNRQHPEAWALKGQILRAQNELEESLECYLRALSYKPNNPSSRVALAEIYNVMGRPQRALATLDKLADDQSAELIPAKAWLQKGQAWSILGQTADAKKCWRHAALCANDSETDLLLELAKIQYSAGELAESRLCLGRALRNNPNNPLALSFQQQLDESFDKVSQDDKVAALPASWLDPRSQ